MITEKAVVTACSDGRAEVSLLRASACGGCEMSQGCGTGAVGRLLGKRSRPLVIETGQDLKPGDQLLLGLSETALVKASLIVYGLPLLGMIGAGLLAALLDLGESLVALLSLAGFIVGFKVGARVSRGLEVGPLTPYIIEIKVNPQPISGSYN